MKVELILKAIDALNDARKALRTGAASMPEQMRIGHDCSDASSKLRRALVEECPEIQITDEGAA